MRAVLRTPFGETFVRDVGDGKWQEPSGDADVVVGEDGWAIPGLVDAHSHLAAAELNYRPGVFEDAIERARESLLAGVTLILDKGWTDDVTIRVIDSLEPAERPDIEAAARIIASPGGYYPGFAREIDPDDIEATARDEAEAGRGWIKVIGDWPRMGVGPAANFDEAELRRFVSVADETGTRVAIHTMARDVPSMAVAAGVHSIEHGLFLTDDDLAALGERDGMWVPTLLRNEALVSQLGEESSGGRLFVEGLENIRSLIPVALEAGVHVLAGTDLIGSPANVAAEALKLSEYGMTNRQVVHAISRAAFSAIGHGDPFSVGAPANAVFFGDNPSEELGVLEHPAAIIRLGRRL